MMNAFICKSLEKGICLSITDPSEVFYRDNIDDILEIIREKWKT